MLDRKKGLYLKNAGVKGRGLFCTSNIKADEELEVTPALIMNDKDNAHTDKTMLLNYVFTTGKISKRLRERAKITDMDKTSCIVMGIASFCNHDQNPNAEVVWEERSGTLYYILRATRRIPKDTEICTSYGETWFDERNQVL